MSWSLTEEDDGTRRPDRGQLWIPTDSALEVGITADQLQRITARRKSLLESGLVVTHHCIIFSFFLWLRADPLPQALRPANQVST